MRNESPRSRCVRTVGVYGSGLDETQQPRDMGGMNLHKIAGEADVFRVYLIQL